MYRLCSERDEDKRLIASWDTEPSFDEVYDKIKEFAKNTGYEMPYLRYWTDEHGATWYDFGSWSTFCILEKLT